MHPTLLLLAFLAPHAVNPDREAEILALGREFTEKFYNEDYDDLWDSFAEEMKEAFGAKATLQAFHLQLDEQLGAETAVIEEKVQPLGEHLLFVRTARFEKLPQVFQVTWAFDDDDTVIGFTITPVREPYPSEFLDYQTKTRLRLPFAETWHVFWGGRTLEQNYHAFTRDQRFAYDIMILKDGKSHSGEGKVNRDYYCFGKPVLSPGEGTIAAMASGVEDNVPGEMNPQQALGNHVIIDHGNGEFSLLAHFQQHSVKVAKGDKVKAGDLLGLCGNSGNSTEAHIHYHLQNTPVFGDGDGLPLAFVDLLVDGKPVERAELTKGQEVAPQVGGIR